MTDNNRPKVGVGVLIIKEGKVLLGHRLSAHGEGRWSLAGGHLEYGESFAECALREVAEEVGLEITTPTYVMCTNDVFESEDKHYVTVFMRAEWIRGNPQVLEPDKVVTWQWFEWENLPQPLFLPIIHLIDSGFQLIQQ